MKRLSRGETVEDIFLITGNRPVASAIDRSVALALRCPFVHLNGGQTGWDVFKKSLDAAIRDIEEHPLGKLFRRLVEYGPLNPECPDMPISDGKTTLSDTECGLCVEFIYSHMVNRFKGELAELLSLEPCIKLIQRLQEEGHLPLNAELYWSDTIQERRRIVKGGGEGNDVQWGSFAKGADGLLVSHIETNVGQFPHSLCIHGIVEVKSMTLAKRRILDQINRHINRLNGGVKLERREYLPDAIGLDSSGQIRVVVVPSTWRLSREWRSVESANGERVMIFPEPSNPPVKTRVEELEPSLWQITLDWSEEALSQAAYEMTFWYMSQVGLHVYTPNNIPKGWEYMTPEEAGRNAIKMMLYYLPLRYISKRQQRFATRLYNVYSFGYQLGVDRKEMLWPEDFPHEVEKQE